MHFVNFPHVSACAVRSIPELPKFSGEIFGNSEIFTTFAVRNAREVGKMSFVMQLRGYPPRTTHKTSWQGKPPHPMSGRPRHPLRRRLTFRKFADLQTAVTHALNLKLDLKFIAMFANVQPTRSLKSSLYYDRALRNPEKGGKVIMANGVGLDMSPTAQLAMLEAYVNEKFKVKAYSVVISHSKEDNDRLEDPKFRDLLLHEFVNECKNRGIDLDNIPYVIPEHVNTDCDHYHMLMLINHFDGTRINTQYLGKRMALAAVEVSKKYGLHYPEGWDEREDRKKKHQASGLSITDAGNKRERKPRTRTDKPATPATTPTTSKVGLSEDEEKKLKDRIRRHNAVLEAKKRKEKEDEAKRQAERDSKETAKVQKQEAERGKENGKGNDKPEAERENKPRWHR